MSTSEPVELETIAVTPSARRYLEALLSYGLLEGEPGEQQINGSAQSMLGGLHHVLGGGTVSIDLRSDGTGSVVGDLNSLLHDALHEWNQLRQPGYEVRF
jgi:hypothetical protein